MEPITAIYIIIALICAKGFVSLYDTYSRKRLERRIAAILIDEYRKGKN